MVLGNLIGDIIDSIIADMLFSYIATTDFVNYLSNQERYPRWFSFKLNHFKYGIIKRAMIFLVSRTSRISLKALGFRVVNIII